MTGRLERLREEIGKVKAMMYGDSTGYAAARAALRQALEAVRKNRIGKAEKLVREAQALVEREKSLWQELKSIEDRIRFGQGYSSKLAGRAAGLLKSGEIEQAEKLVQELSKGVEEENRAYARVEEAERLISQRLAGAKIEEAERLVAESIEAIKEGEYARAEELAEKARLTAKPTTEYLLTSARGLADKAKKAFDSENYDEAIELWKESISEYSRAKEVAEERGERELVESVEGAIATLQENITKAEVAIDNRSMLALIEQANRLVGDANRSYSSGDYTAAKRKYEEAKEKFLEAKRLAEKRGFEEKEELEEAVASAEDSIEACLLSKGRAMLERSEGMLQEGKAKEAEKAFEEAKRYLESLEVKRTEERDDMLAEARQGVVEAKILQARQRMETAERDFSGGEYYKAKEVYREVQDYLNRVMDEAAKYGLQEHVAEIDSLISACQSNATSAILAMTQVDDVGGIKIIRAGEIVKGRARIQKPPKLLVRNRTAEQLLKYYREVEYIGGGGFADVYRCVTKDGSVIAVKVPRNIDEKTEQIFFNEVKRWQELKHRNIIKLIRPRLEPARIEMEYADGGSLHELLRNTGKLDVVRACQIAYDIASALEYSHGKGIWHTDVNPKNILLTSTGEAKLTDFGLAKIAASSSEVKGFTLPYSAPEQLNEKKADERTDIYQLGLTLYVMLSGENPFDAGTRVDTERMIGSLVPEKIEGIDEELNEFILRCLAKDRRKRPSAREFREFIYSFMKRRYNISLHLTRDWRKESQLALRNAMYAAKECDYAECLNSIKYLKNKVHDAELREEVRGLYKEVEHRFRDGLPLEPLLDRMEALLRRL